MTMQVRLDKCTAALIGVVLFHKLPGNFIPSLHLIVSGL
jgi:hypothetical protein